MPQITKNIRIENRGWRIALRNGIFRKIRAGHMPGGTWLYCIGPLAVFHQTKAKARR